MDSISTASGVCAPSRPNAAKKASTVDTDESRRSDKLTTLREQLIRAALNADDAICEVALATLTGQTALLTPAKIKKLTGRHVRTLTRRGLKPHVQGGRGQPNLYLLKDVQRFASLPPLNKDVIAEASS